MRDGYRGMIGGGIFAVLGEGVTTAGCASAMVVLFYEMFVSNRKTFYIVLGIALALLMCREAYIWLHSRYKGKNQ